VPRAPLLGAVEALDVATQVGGPRPAEAVDGLVVVGHAVEVGARLAEAADDVELHRVGVLKFIDEDRPRLAHEVGPHVRVIAQQVARLDEQVVKVERAPVPEHLAVGPQALGEPPRHRVDPELDAADVGLDLAVAVEVGCLAPALVRLVPALPEGVGHRVVDHDEVVGHARRGRMGAEGFVAEVVNGARPDVLRLRAHEGGESTGELLRGAPREGDQDEAGRRHGLVLDEVGGPAHEDARLAGPRPGHHELRIHRRRHGGPLVGVEVGPVGGAGGHGAWA
jgi:hypothetical protein